MNRLIFTCCFLLTSIIVDAGTFTVTNLNDAGPGSLRQAMFDAQATSEQDDIINIMVSGIINLTTAQTLDIVVLPNAVGMTINGDADGDNQPIILAMDASIGGRFFQIENSTINDVVFDGGSAALTGGAIFATGTNFFNRCLMINGTAGGTGLEFGRGGGIRVNNGSTTMTDCTIRGNTAGRGAAVRVDGSATLSLFNCTIADNVVPAGGLTPSTIWLDGTLNMTNCIIADTSPDGTPDIVDEGNTVNTNVNNHIENFQCNNPATCGSLTFASTGDPMLVPTSSDPYFVYSVAPNSPIANMGRGASMAPGGAAIPATFASATEPIPTLGEWGLVIMAILFSIFSLIAIREEKIQNSLA